MRRIFATVALSLFLLPSLVWAQETCLGDQCTVPGSVYRSVTDIKVSGALTNGLLAQLVGDDSTDNTAALTAIINAMNGASGAVVTLPTGTYRYHAGLLPLITAKSAGIVGQGSGCGGQLRAGTPLGTVLRNLDRTGNDLSVSGGSGVRLEHLCFWPVFHKTSGYAISLTQDAQYTHIDDVTFWYPFRTIQDSGTTYTQTSNIIIYDNFDTVGIEIDGGAGASVQGGGGSIYRNCFGIQTDSSGVGNVPQPGVSFTKTSYVGNSQAVTKGWFMQANGVVWVASKGGITASSGTGPTLPAYTFSQDLSQIPVVDGTVQWTWYSDPNYSYFVADSGAVAVMIEDCQVTQTGRFLTTRNTLASGIAPKQIEVTREIGNSFWDRGIYHTAGWGLALNELQIVASVLNPAAEITSATQGLTRFNGGYYADSPGPTVLIGNNSAASGGNGETLTGAVVCGSGAVTPGPALEIANSGTTVSGGSYGRCSVASAAASLYGIQIDVSAADYHVLGALVKGSSADYNNLSANEGEGVPVAFTPSLFTSGSGVGNTYSQQLGTYIVIGKEVLGEGYITLTGLTSNSGPVDVTLPLGVGSQSGSGSVIQASNFSSLTGALGVRPTASTATARLFQTGATGASDITNANVGNTTNIAYGFRYRIN